jgi:alkylation response protein AidB-like acyl-CoA dehydrogenase
MRFCRSSVPRSFVTVGGETQIGHNPAAGGTWRVSGTRTWISRLTEAALFCVLFTAPDGKLTAAAIDAGAEPADHPG